MSRPRRPRVPKPSQARPSTLAAGRQKQVRVWLATLPTGRRLAAASDRAHARSRLSRRKKSYKITTKKDLGMMMPGGRPPQYPPPPSPHWPPHPNWRLFGVVFEGSFTFPVRRREGVDVCDRGDVRRRRLWRSHAFGDKTPSPIPLFTVVYFDLSGHPSLFIAPSPHDPPLAINLSI